MRRIAVALIGAMLSLAAAGAHPWQRYTDPTLGYTIAYPSGWTLDTHYVNETLGPGHEIKGVSLTVPAAFTQGTNLGGDTKLSIESLPGHDCQPAQFVDPATNVHRIRSHGIGYSVATSEDAGAGNRYETTVYVVDGTCIALRVFIHYSAIENFDPSSGVKAFDRAKLDAAFDRIRAAFRLAK